MRLRVALLLAVGAAAAGRAQAPPAFAPVDGVGLPHGTVQALLQDRRGFLWVGTADGLVRYDGRRGRVFARRPGRADALASTTVQALAEGPDGALWVGTAAGACRLADEARGRFDCPPPRHDVLDVRIADDGVWAVTAEALWHLRDGAFRRVEGPYRGEGVMRNARVRDGRLLLLEGPVGGQAVRAAFVGPDGRRGPAATATLPPATVGLAGGAGEVLALPLAGADAPGWGVLGRTVTASADGATWVGADAGLFRWDGRALAAVPLAAGSVLGGAVLAVAVDGAGAVWVGTRSGLLVHDPARARFAHLDPAADGAASPVMAVETDRAGRRWVGTLGGGLLRYEEGRPERVDLGPGGEVVWAVHARPEAVWVGTDGGLCRVDGAGRRCWREPLARPTGQAYVYALADDGAGGVWAGGSALVRLDADGRELRRVPFDALSGRATLSALHLDRRGRLWVGGEKRGLWRIDAPEAPVRRVAPALATTTVWAVHEAAGGALWLATSDGLVRLDPATGEVAGHAEGLPSSTVYSVEASGPDLWLATARGLARYRPATGALRVFGPGDGVRTVEFNRRASHRAPDGTLWFGGMAGATAFDPDALGAEAPPPPVVVTRVRVEASDGEAVYGPADLPRLGPEVRTVALDLAAPAPSGGAGLRLATRLDDGPWTELAGEPTVRFAGLGAGAYRVEARASWGDGTWGPPAAVAFEIAPPWHATAWARALAALALGLGLALAWRARVRAIRREERMRWRIASDLHDDVGSGLASVALLADHVRERADLTPGQDAQLSTVARAAHTMVERLREIVWFVDPAHEGPGAFSARVRETARALVGPEAALDLPARSALDAAPPGWRRDLFLVVKEALHNAARHAPGAPVAVRVAVADGAAEVEVRDEGPGFDPAATPEGTGLRSLRRRAEALGGALEVETAPGEGTRVRLTAPLP